MCGIAGIVSRGGPLPDPRGLADRLQAALAHRGPDAAGRWISPDEDVVLVHRRLAIIDPGDDGAQPMRMATGQLMVFNGEIYNYRELRRELEARGERMRTASDTEVLMRLLAVDGPGSLRRVRGMFAFAFWNPASGSLLLARDRFGMKPMYVAASPRQIAFASELRALCVTEVIDRRPSAAGVLAFLEWGSVPAPLAIVEGVEALAPGCWWRWHLGGREERGQFADVRRPYGTSQRRTQSVEAFGDSIGAAVQDSVRAHLIADVPVGVFLSGGIDSSAIVSAATSAGATSLQTFTVTFDAPGSEAEAARAVAESFGTDHHELRVDASHLVEDWPAILGRLDQPTIDGVNSFYVSRAVASTGIKAVLSGVGGDELFGGYPSFRRLPRATAMTRAAGRAFPAAARIARGVVPRRLRSRWEYFASTPGSLGDAYRVQRGFLLPNEVMDLAGPALRDRWQGAAERLRDVEAGLLQPAAEETPEAGVARLETRLFLGSQLLRDIDAMSMAHGLEVRTPFVDHELAAATWPELGFHRSWLAGKRLLHSTLEKALPAAIVSRPKQGFTLPFQQWIGGELAPLVQDGMRALASAGWLHARAPDAVWHAWRAGTVHWSRPWGLAVLGHFLTPRDRIGTLDPSSIRS